MKKSKSIIVVLGAALLYTCCGHKGATTADSDSAVAGATAATDSVTGKWEVHEGDGYRLHIYLSGDGMADASFIVEGKDSLVTLEQPLFVNAGAEYDSYLAKLNKPVARRVSDFHLGNTGDAVLTMPQGMPEVVKGKDYSGMMAHFAEEYGDAIVPLPTGATVEVPFDRQVTLGGVDFVFYKGAVCDFPGADILIGKDVVYTHFAPARAHIDAMYAGTREGVESRLAESVKMRETGAKLFVGGHGLPAGTDELDFRINYLKKVLELLDSAGDAATFASELKKAYPGLAGEENVAALAEALYKTA